MQTRVQAPRGVVPRGARPGEVMLRVRPRKSKRASPRKSRQGLHLQTASDGWRYLQTSRITGRAVNVATKTTTNSMRRRRGVQFATTRSVMIANPSVAPNGLAFEIISVGVRYIDAGESALAYGPGPWSEGMVL